MAQVLDRSRPFAEVHGISDVRYEQDGLPFDYSGNLMVPASDGAVVVVDGPKRRGGRPKKVVESSVEGN
jgi:hypothetical protein